MEKAQILVTGYMLVKGGYPQNLYKEAIYIYKTPQEAESAKDGYSHAIAKYLSVYPVKIVLEIQPPHQDLR